jgi:hypothetical protein
MNMASRRRRRIVVRVYVANWMPTTIAAKRMMPLQRNEADASGMDEDLLVTSRMMTRRASGLGRRGGRGYAADERNRTPRKLK